MNAVRKVWFDAGRIFVETDAGEALSQPLRFFPRLERADERQRAEWTQSPFGLHWDAIDEDISFESFTWADGDPRTLFAAAL